MDIQLLRQQHDSLEIVAKELLFATSSGPYQSVAIIRWKLARELIAHLSLEDRVLYPAMIDGTNHETALLASRFKTEMGGLAEGFTSYMASWDSQRIVNDWAAFCRETRTILDLLITRIDRENRELYPQAISLDGAGAAEPRQGSQDPLAMAAINALTAVHKMGGTPPASH